MNLNLNIYLHYLTHWTWKFPSITKFISTMVLQYAKYPVNQTTNSVTIEQCVIKNISYQTDFSYYRESSKYIFKQLWHQQNNLSYLTGNLSLMVNTTTCCCLFWDASTSCLRTWFFIIYAKYTARYSILEDSLLLMS